MSLSFVNSIFNAERDKLSRQVSDLRYYRNTAALQDGFRAAVESFGLNRPLMMVASQSPEIMALFDEEAVPSIENLNVVGDKSVHLKDGIGEKTLKSAGIADWMEDTRDSLSGFCETANYHMAGIQKRCQENADRIGAHGINERAMVNAPSFENRNTDVNHLLKALDIVNTHWNDDVRSADETAAELVNVTGICKMNDDYETSPEGMYCLERFSAGSLSSLGYNEDNLRHLLTKAEQMLSAARHLVDNGADLITARYNEDTKEENNHPDSELSEEAKAAKQAAASTTTSNPEDQENVEGRYDEEHPNERNIAEREDNPDAPMPHAPAKVDPERRELETSTESLDDIFDDLEMLHESTESLSGEGVSLEDLLNQSSDEDLQDMMTKMANRVTLISCLIDCATHIGLHLLYISDEALKG